MKKVLLSDMRYVSCLYIKKIHMKTVIILLFSVHLLTRNSSHYEVVYSSKNPMCDFCEKCVATKVDSIYFLLLKGVQRSQENEKTTTTTITSVVNNELNKNNNRNDRKITDLVWS